MQRVGSRAQVMHGNAKMTGGGLRKKDLKYNKQGKIVSKKMSKLAKKEKRLQKAGYTTIKGQFGAVRIMKGGNWIFRMPETPEDIANWIETVEGIPYDIAEAYGDIIYSNNLSFDTIIKMSTHELYQYLSHAKIESSISRDRIENDCRIILSALSEEHTFIKGLKTRIPTEYDVKPQWMDSNKYMYRARRGVWAKIT